MTAKKRGTEPEVRNPRHAGATPETVGRARLRHEPEADDKPSKPSGIIGRPAIQSSI